jgi:hypothetical protein
MSAAEHIVILSEAQCLHALGAESKDLAYAKTCPHEE